MHQMTCWLHFLWSDRTKWVPIPPRPEVAPLLPRRPRITDRKGAVPLYARTEHQISKCSMSL